MESPLYDTPYIPSPSSKKKQRLRDKMSLSLRDNPEGVSMHIASFPQTTAMPSSVKKRKTPKKQTQDSFSSEAFSPVETSAPPTTPVTSAQKKRKHKTQMQVDDSQIFINPEVSVLSSDFRDSGLSDSEIDVDASSILAPSELSLNSMYRTPSMKSNHNKKSAENSSWNSDVAIKEARGSPDGAGDSTLKANDNTKQPSPSVEKEKNNKKALSYEKKKKKPYGALEKAALKIKNMSTSCTQGKKRKLDETDGGKGKEDPQTVGERKKQRKMQKNNYALSQRAKQIWEELRKGNCDAATKSKLCTELYALVRGKARQLIFAHDTSRVVQCLYKHGLPEHRMAIFEELRDDMVVLAKSKYAKFFLLKLLKYGTKNQRDYFFRKLYGKVRKLIKHKEAAAIVEAAYNNYANAAQRSAMVQEFYGPSFSLFKTDELRTIEQIMASHPERRDSILRNMKEALQVLADKAVLRHTIVHRIFLEYFTYAPLKAKTDMIESVREGVVEMLHTRDGARVAMTCLWDGTPKDRKVIVKSFKPYISRICLEEYGHLVMLAVFDSVDDTKLVQKALLTELIKSIPVLAEDQYGRKILYYLLTPRNSAHFHPEIVKILKQGDENPNSKKEVSVRRGELLEFMSRPLIQYASSNCKQLATDNSGLLLLLTIITYAKGDPTDAMRSVAELAAEPYKSGTKDSQSHLIEHNVGNVTLKRLVQNDASRIKEGETALFSTILLDVVPKGGLRTWVQCNRGCFVLITLLELGNTEVTLRIQDELNGLKQSLKKLKFKGAQILLSKLT